MFIFWKLDSIFLSVCVVLALFAPFFQFSKRQQSTGNKTNFPPLSHCYLLFNYWYEKNSVGQTVQCWCWRSREKRFSLAWSDLLFAVGRPDAQRRVERAGWAGHHREDREGGRRGVPVLGQHLSHLQTCQRSLWVTTTKEVHRRQKEAVER